MRKVQVLLLLLIFGLLGISPGGCPPDPNVHYICFGDSITHGLTSKPYPSWLEDFLIADNGEQPGSVANEGVNGDTACESDGSPNARLQAILENHHAKYPNAHTVLYWLGVNDLHRTPVSQIEKCIRSNVKAIQHAGLKVYLGTYFYPAEEIPVLGPYFDALIFYLNADIYWIGITMRIPVAPIEKAFVDEDGHLCDPSDPPICCGLDCYALDGRHPNNFGNYLLAKAWYQTIQ